MKNKITPDDQIILRGRMSGRQKNRLAKLLNMLYTPGELSREIGFSVRQVYRVYIPLGLPHERDKNNRIWINGVSFRRWILEKYRKHKVGADEVFCLTCKKAVKIVDPEKKEHERLIFYLCNCPNCGRRLSRILTRKKLRR